MSLRLQAEARDDIEDAYRWYGGLLEGLGDAFLGELERCFQRIEAFPSSAPVIHRNVRRAILRRFPFCVFYVLADSDIDVIAVMHGSRDPATWQVRR